MKKLRKRINAIITDKTVKTDRSTNYKNRQN